MAGCRPLKQGSYPSSRRTRSRSRSLAARTSLARAPNCGSSVSRSPASAKAEIAGLAITPVPGSGEPERVPRSVRLPGRFYGYGPQSADVLYCAERAVVPLSSKLPADRSSPPLTFQRSVGAIRSASGQSLPDRPTGTAGLVRRDGLRVAGKGAVELAAGADAELGEDLAQVVLDRARADEQLG